MVAGSHKFLSVSLCHDSVCNWFLAFPLLIHYSNIHAKTLMPQIIFRQNKFTRTQPKKSMSAPAHETWPRICMNNNRTEWAMDDARWTLIGKNILWFLNNKRKKAEENYTATALNCEILMHIWMWELNRRKQWYEMLGFSNLVPINIWTISFDLCWLWLDFCVDHFRNYWFAQQLNFRSAFDMHSRFRYWRIKGNGKVLIAHKLIEIHV